MPNNDSTDNSYVNDATTDSAKIWDGDDYSEATWLNELVRTSRPTLSYAISCTATS